MSQAQVISVGDSTAILLAPEALREIGARIGDFLDIEVTDRRLVLRPVDEEQRQQQLREATNDVLQRRASALQKLAE
jgi:antitoxin component of MazEF toxin-antitoxin module